MGTLEAKRGDTLRVRVGPLVDDNGPVSLLGKILTFSAKYRYIDTDYALQKSTGTIGVDVDTYIIDVATASEMEDFANRVVRLVYDVELESGSEVYTVDAGLLIISPDVTV
jgi:hypothetical protein